MSGCCHGLDRLRLCIFSLPLSIKLHFVSLGTLRLNSNPFNEWKQSKCWSATVQLHSVVNPILFLVPMQCSVIVGLTRQSVAKPTVRELTLFCSHFLWARNEWLLSCSHRPAKSINSLLVPLHHHTNEHQLITDTLTFAQSLKSQSARSIGTLLVVRELWH